ncbi:hypothetical protein LCGC14_0862230 [marine sediment metagenome]|uniref:Uncharacterized protein n=1 Tax=marine sediment metagenome TaxID=412755 RepID=A0A0F9PC32_9ZZZZ
MYRRERDLAHTLWAQRRFATVRSWGWWGDVFPDLGEWASQSGRFRKETRLGCPNGRSKCGVCSGGVREPTRQEVRSNIDFEEYRKEVDMSAFQ